MDYCMYIGTTNTTLNEYVRMLDVDFETKSFSLMYFGEHMNMWKWAQDSSNVSTYKNFSSPVFPLSWARILEHKTTLALSISCGSNLWQTLCCVRTPKIRLFDLQGHIFKGKCWQSLKIYCHQASWAFYYLFATRFW